MSNFDPGPAVSGVGNALVFSTNGGGHPPEFWAQRLTDRIVQSADKAPDIIRDQVHAFKAEIYANALFYIQQAITSDRANQALKNLNP